MDTETIASAAVGALLSGATVKSFLTYRSENKKTLADVASKTLADMRVLIDEQIERYEELKKENREIIAQCKNLQEENDDLSKRVKHLEDDNAKLKQKLSDANIKF